MRAPVRKPIITLNWQLWAIVFVILALVLLVTAGISF